MKKKVKTQTMVNGPGVEKDLLVISLNKCFDERVQHGRVVTIEKQITYFFEC